MSMQGELGNVVPGGGHPSATTELFYRREDKFWWTVTYLQPSLGRSFFISKLGMTIMIPGSHDWREN